MPSAKTFNGPLDVEIDSLNITTSLSGPSSFTRGTVLVDASSDLLFIDDRSAPFYSAMLIVIPLIFVLSLDRIITLFTRK